MGFGPQCRAELTVTRERDKPTVFFSQKEVICLLRLSLSLSYDSLFSNANHLLNYLYNENVSA